MEADEIGILSLKAETWPSDDGSHFFLEMFHMFARLVFLGFNRSSLE